MVEVAPTVDTQALLVLCLVVATAQARTSAAALTCTDELHTLQSCGSASPSTLFEICCDAVAAFHSSHCFWCGAVALLIARHTTRHSEIEHTATTRAALDAVTSTYQRCTGTKPVCPQPPPSASAALTTLRLWLQSLCKAGPGQQTLAVEWTQDVTRGQVRTTHTCMVLQPPRS